MRLISALWSGIYVNKFLFVHVVTNKYISVAIPQQPFTLKQKKAPSKIDALEE